MQTNNTGSLRPPHSFSLLAYLYSVSLLLVTLWMPPKFEINMHILPQKFEINMVVKDDIYRRYIQSTWISPPPYTLTPRWPFIMSTSCNCRTVSLSFLTTFYTIRFMGQDPTPLVAGLLTSPTNKDKAPYPKVLEDLPAMLSPID